MPQADKIIKLAERQIGNNAKKYREWYYGYDATGVAWCAVFVSWLFSKCEVKMVKTDGAGCFAREGNGIYGMWYQRSEITPKEGDIITFRWGGSYTDLYHSDHVGIVYHTDKNNVYTIEGNTGGTNDTSAVSYRAYNKSDSRINGYFRPFYSEREEEEMNFKQGDKSDGVLAYKALLLLANDYNVIPVKIDNNDVFGQGTYDATIAVQKLFNLEVDGIAGKQTISALSSALHAKAITSTKGHNKIIDDLGKKLTEMKV